MYSSTASHFTVSLASIYMMLFYYKKNITLTEYERNIGCGAIYIKVKDKKIQEEGETESS